MFFLGKKSRSGLERKGKVSTFAHRKRKKDAGSCLKEGCADRDDGDFFGFFGEVFGPFGKSEKRFGELGKSVTFAVPSGVGQRRSGAGKKEKVFLAGMEKSCYLCSPGNGEREKR